MTYEDEIEAQELVFIHGAWVSGWGWESLIPHLESKALNCHVVDLPGSESKAISLKSQATLTDYVDHVCAVMDSINKPVWLVAHSGGGVTATAVAERVPEKVLGIIYVAGMMLPSGMSYGDLCGKVTAETGVDLKGILPYLTATEFGTYIEDPASIKKIFLQDASDKLVSEVSAKMVVQPDASRLVSANWSDECAGRVPKFYIEALNDNSLLLPVQKAMQKLTPPVKSASLACGHFPQVIMPVELANLIKGFIY